jgi:hypothetical protein
MYGINVRYKCMQVLTYIQVLFNTTTTKYAILDLLLLNADTDVSTHCTSKFYSKFILYALGERRTQP